MDKTKATLQEKAEKMTAQTPAEKEMAEERKREKIQEAEITKQETMQHNGRSATAHAGGHITDPRDRPVAGAPGVVAGHPTGGQAVSGVTESRPIGRATGTGREALRRPQPLCRVD
ncbi:18 kDa seed maturation protein-like [Canna indica]|uniref:18 kDa seed maturation protein-like n=1 Tax=Canna indica TaxID=4628 RepID=A0AAQ3JS30_9LILI|nr:18 kDa seed maturation protein-like [Canna indica]